MPYQTHHVDVFPGASLRATLFITGLLVAGSAIGAAPLAAPPAGPAPSPKAQSHAAPAEVAHQIIQYRCSQGDPTASAGQGDGDF